MTRSQAEILERIAALPEADRRTLVEHLVEAHLGEDSFLQRMSPAQRQQLQDGIAEADRGQMVPAEVVFDRIATRR